MSRGLNEEEVGVRGEGVPGRGKSQGKSPEAGMCKEAHAAVARRQEGSGRRYPQRGGATVWTWPLP